MYYDHKISAARIRKLAGACRMESRLLEQILEYDLVPASYLRQEEESRMLEHLRRVRRLHEDLEINLEGIGVILEMRENLVQMKQRLKKLEQEIEETRRAHDQEISRRMRKAGLFIDLD